LVNPTCAGGPVECNYNDGLIWEDYENNEAPRPQRLRKPSRHYVLP
jgi:hypothetical protein